MARCLIDANITLTWLFDEDDRRTALDQQFQSLELVAPWLWRLEVVHAILVRERRKHITQAQGSRYLQALESLGIEIVDEPVNRTLTGLAQTARPHQLSSYDAVYLDLAVSLRLPLFTDDGNLRDAAERVGVNLIQPA